MKKQLFIHYVFYCIALACNGQVPKFQAGVATGNLLTIANAGFDENLSSGNLIRYKAGVLFRTRLKEKFKLPKPFPQPKKGVIALDYGIGFVANGYSYQYRGLEHFRDQLAIEVPLLLVLYDKSDFWMSRKNRRKGLATFARMGFRFSYLIHGQAAYLISNDQARLQEQGEYGGFNFYWSVGGGLLRTTKSGRTCSVSISGNIGWIRQTNLMLNYEDHAGRREEVNFTSNNSYLDIEAIYLFSRPTPFSNLGKTPKVIYNPRF